MVTRPPLALVALMAIFALHIPPVVAQDALPIALNQLLDTDRRFATRARDVGWGDASLEFFADAAVSFARGQAGPARVQILEAATALQAIAPQREARYGDVSGSGELGYLTGPERTVQASGATSRPGEAVYVTLWRQQRSGAFAIVLDVRTPTPRAAAFAEGFTRAPHADRFQADYDENTPPLSAADSVLNSALRLNQARAYRDRLAAGARLHRPNLMPLVGDAAILRWLGTQPALSAADTQFSDAARSGDLGYTWGTYSHPASGAVRREAGFYVRVWVRERNGQWKVAADVTLPQ